jgi:hypothetical protein
VVISKIQARKAAYEIEKLLRLKWRDFPEENVTNIILKACNKSA